MCRGISEIRPNEIACIKPLEPLTEKSGAYVVGFSIPLADLSKNAEFEDITPYRAKKGRKEAPFVLKPYIFPLKLDREGKTWTLYKFAN